MLLEKEKTKIQTFLQLTEIIKNVSSRDLLETIYTEYIKLEESFQELKKKHMQLEMIYKKQSDLLMKYHEKFKEMNK